MDMRPEIYVGERIVRNNHKIEREKMMLSLRKKKLALPQRSLHIFSILSLKQISFFLFVLCFKNIYSDMIMRQKRASQHTLKKMNFLPANCCCFN